MHACCVLPAAVPYVHTSRGGDAIESGANFKHAQFLPKGNGDITGIIMPRHTETSLDAAS